MNGPVTRGDAARRAALIVFLMLLTLSPVEAGVLTPLYRFLGGADGAAPSSRLLFDTSGALYGTAASGGASGFGAIYKLTPPVAGQTSWGKTLLYSFKGGKDGAAPGSLTMDTFGALYGVTREGGNAEVGAVFKLSPPPPGKTVWTKSTVYNFIGKSTGKYPTGKLTFDSSGNLYGSTRYGGASGYGAIYKLTPDVTHTLWTGAVLYNFEDGVDGGVPSGGLAIDTTGALFGVVYRGGSASTAGKGAIFKLSPPAAGKTQWTKTLVHSFEAGADGGAWPTPELLLGAKGVIYGTTLGERGGEVFRLTPPTPGQSDWTFANLYGFRGGKDGKDPLGELAFGPSGQLYGTTALGGDFGHGVIFRLMPPAPGEAAWRPSILHHFGDGERPGGGVIADTRGALYGASLSDGAGGGFVYRLDFPVAARTPRLHAVLYDFRGGADGVDPHEKGPLALDARGALYGTTFSGGRYDRGTIFRLTPPPSGQTAWTKETLHSFVGAEGYGPRGGVIFDNAGALYGTTNSSTNGYGTVYKLTPPGWTASVLHEFHWTDGIAPRWNLVFDTNGAVYGMTVGGGASDCGVVFRLKPNGAGWTRETLYAMPGSGGCRINSTPIFDSTGAVYGITAKGSGARDELFKVSPPAAGQTRWTKTILTASTASGLWGTPIWDTNGALYGTAPEGGVGGKGEVYMLTPPAPGQTQWKRTVLHSFGGTDGGPGSGVIAVNGALYGATCGGGPVNAGVIFRLTPPSQGETSWRFKTLHEFNRTDGACPMGGLVADANGVVYGATRGGGAYGYGTIFSLE